MSDDVETTDRSSKLEPVIRDVVAALRVRPEDQGLAALAIQYAAAIDAMAEVARRAWAIEFAAAGTGEFAAYPKAYDQLRALQHKVAWRATLTDLGPRLLAVLEALGASPKTRKALGLNNSDDETGVTDDEPASATGDAEPDDELARYRRGRTR